MFVDSPPAEEIVVCDWRLAVIADRLCQWNPKMKKETIKLLRVDEKTWRDGALGCPVKGLCYTQALIRGYLFWIEWEGTVYEVHTDHTLKSMAMPGVGFF